MATKKTLWPVTTVAIILGMFVLPACQQDEPLPTTEGARQDGVDQPEIFLILRERADEGNAEAQLRLGFMYHDGTDVPQDYKEALRWYRAAADQGLAGAQSQLGAMYVAGQGVPQDDVRAHMWYNLSASNSTGDEAKRAVQFRDLLAGLMTSEQIAEAQRLAREWKPKTGSQ